MASSPFRRATALVLMVATIVVRGGMINKYQPRMSYCGEDNRIHTLSYNLTTFDDSHFYDLDGHDFDDIEDVSCNNDGSQVQLKFHEELNAIKYATALRNPDSFLTGGKKYKNCLTVNPKNVSGVLVKRVVTSDRDGQYVKLRTALSRYDEIYQEGDIQYASGGTCNTGVGDGKKVCIGFNTDCTNGATQPLPLYQNQFLDITCSNCFLGYSTDLHFEVKISDWTLKSIEVGYTNMTMAGALIITAVAQADWSTGIDRTLMLANDVSLIDFHVGPVPFRISLDIPVQISADIEFHAEAVATFGSESIWDIGDHYVSWDPDNHWQHHTPDPKLINTAKIRNASADFDATVTFSVAPSIAMHIDTIITYRAGMTPTLVGEVKGDTTTKQICTSLTYDLAITAETELDIAIPVLNINDDWVWNKQVYDSGTQTLEQACTTPSNTSSVFKHH